MRMFVLLVSLMVLSACRASGKTTFIVDRDEDGLSDEEDCDDEDPTIGIPTTYYADLDADGHGDPNAGDGACAQPVGYSEAGDDCDDGNSATYPGAPELCDGVDNDCDSMVDDGVAVSPWYSDVDGDGFGDGTTAVEVCAAPEGMIADGTDCDDSDGAINPSATEICDGIDNDCDGTADDGFTVSTWYTDADADGYGDDGSATTTCAPEAGSVEVAGDCDDADANFYPGAIELCTNPNDYNCDGSTGYADNDGDSFPACEECDDGDAAIFPGADEFCNGVDDDCDGNADEDALDPSTWYADIDGDGFGDAGSILAACDVPGGYVADASDCDDGRADVNPDASEVCDGFDNDCDALVDDADSSLDVSSASTWYTDADGDGFGDSAGIISACDAPLGTAPFGGDCDDGDVAYNPAAPESDCADPNDYNCDGSAGAVDTDSDGYFACEECDDANANNFPGADEYCDGRDNDCDGAVDEDDALDAATWYADTDVDGFGDAGMALMGCDAPADYVADATDCDDANREVNPAKVEVCNGIDDNCDDVIDTDAADSSVWYSDSDGDGFGDVRSATSGCEAPVGYVADDGDCDDADVSVNPAAPEVCDSLDNDCDGSTDEEGASTTYYADLDGDSFGDASTAIAACVPPAGYLADSADCDDSRADINPAATEVCDGLDNDCDTLIDDADGSVDTTTASVWYVDLDSDGYGDTGSVVTACEAPADGVSLAGDCDDADAAYNPGASESDCADPNDYNCDGAVGATDGDADGFYACEECDDTDAAVNPNADEACNGQDDDCDGSVDESDAIDASTWYVDADSDGYGDDASQVTACEAPADAISLAGDCDDSDSAYNPAAIEADCADPNDYNCDGSVGAIDGDGDGYYACEECDDGDATINPGAAEACNSVDDDCDGTVDDGAAMNTYYSDADSDGYGDALSTTTACSAPSGYVADDTDCDDASLVVNPGATEVCDLIDNDCDGRTDESVQLRFYADTDGDTYGNRASTTSACTAPSGYVRTSTDCDDTRAEINPAATEVCDGLDNDCDTLIDDADGSVDTTTASVWYVDLDSDGYGDTGSFVTACEAPADGVSLAGDCDDADAAYNPGASESDCADPNDYNCDGAVGAIDGDADGFYACEECDDTDAAVNPNADEACNGQDDDCDGSVDEADAIDMLTWYADADSDGFGSASTLDEGCSAPAGFVVDNTDCNDGNANINPAEAEVCNGIDDDCDGAADDGVATSTYYADADNDGYGNDASPTVSCSAPAGSVAIAGDCDDSDSAYNPAAIEADCTDPNDYNCDGAVGAADGDGDGYYACEECDDGDATVNPSAPESCNGVDDDCDGTVDDGVTMTTYYADADSDGYGDAGTALSSCVVPSGYVADATDCDDMDGAINPGATEVCDFVDNDCDGRTDESVRLRFYADTDGDTYGNLASTANACTAPSGYVSSSTDCDDTEASIHPGATETCNAVDDDCDGTVDDGVATTIYYADADSDGYGDALAATTSCAMPAGYVAGSNDCDDTDGAIHPGATEVCDNADNDCDGSIDEGLRSTWYADADTDGYGDSTTAAIACSAPSGYVAVGADCDDTNAGVNPGATESCNATDDDCDGSIDEGLGTTWYADADTDGYGDSATATVACSAPSGYVATNTDCDDTEGAINPAATEVCDTIDNDCDGSADEGLGHTVYADTDGDGYGDAGSALSTCSSPAGYVTDNSDCDDSDAAIHPGAAEACDGRDNDCDGGIDEGLAIGDFYADLDADGYGDAGSAVSACTTPPAYVSDGTDCDDTNGAINPAATEVCDGLDNDCDGGIDEGTPSGSYYADADSDGYGDAGTALSACAAPSGYVADATDCDDTASAINPGATEVCDGADNDCDGTTDEGLLGTYYVDADSDAYGTNVGSIAACTAPSGYVSVNTDCDDTNAAINPGATEVCDEIDNDCDGSIDEGFASVTWYDDADGDGYGDPDTAVATCATAPSGYIADNTDCDDTDPAINPAATEVCDTLDNNCDGSIDEGGVCPCPVEVYDGRSYLFCDASADWTTARANCLSYGYELADVLDDAENTWIVATASTYAGGKWWIGLNDVATEGTYAWSSGAAVSYLNWGSSEPSGKGPADCTNVKMSKGTWSDQNCASALRYVCEE